jgi:hypothetical protein
MLPHNAIWLVPGQHPTFTSASRVLASIFRSFEMLDYRNLYFVHGGKGLEHIVRVEREARNANVILYTQFPSSYAYIRPQFLAGLRDVCIVVGLGWDDEMYFEQAKYFYQACSALITTDETAVDFLNTVGVPTYLAPLHDESEMSYEGPVIQDISVSFVGDMTKAGRREYVEYLEKNGVEVKDYGIGSRYGRVESAETIFRRSRINLNFVGTNPPAWIARHDPVRATFKQMKSRPFELALFGCFCLCEWAPVVHRWFREDEEIATFRNPDHLVTQAKRYLADEMTRQKIANAAHARYEAELRLSVYLERLFPKIIADVSGRTFGAFATTGNMYAESLGRSSGVSMLHALRRLAPLRAIKEAFGEGSATPSYWRGFAEGLKDAVNSRISMR